MTTLEKLEQISAPAPSDWREKAQWRKDNCDWLRKSHFEQQLGCCVGGYRCKLGHEPSETGRKDGGDETIHQQNRERAGEFVLTDHLQVRICFGNHIG